MFILTIQFCYLATLLFLLQLLTKELWESDSYQELLHQCLCRKNVKRTVDQIKKKVDLSLFVLDLVPRKQEKAQINLKETRKHAEDIAPGRPKVVEGIFWSLEPLVSERSCCSRIQGLISAKAQERAESISSLIIEGALIPECSRQEKDRQS